MTIAAQPSQANPNPAIPTRQQMIDAAVRGLLGTVFNLDGSTSVRLVQVTDDGKLAVGGDVTALFESQRTAVVDALVMIATELRVHSILLLAQSPAITDDLDALRRDVQLNPQQS